MFFLPIFFVILVGTIIFAIMVKRRNRGYGKEFEEFFERENEANYVKSRDFEPEIFFKPDISKLPVKQEGSSNSGKKSFLKQQEVLRRAEKTMVKLPAPMTNTELKFKYGTVNLEAISEYEENFFTYTYAVNDWAEALIEEGNDKEAEAVLYHGVTSGAETSKTYTLLADLYFKYNKRAEMTELYDIISNQKMPAQRKTWEYINNYYIKMGL